MGLGQTPTASYERRALPTAAPQEGVCRHAASAPLPHFRPARGGSAFALARAARPPPARPVLPGRGRGPAALCCRLLGPARCGPAPPWPPTATPRSSTTLPKTCTWRPPPPRRESRAAAALPCPALPRSGPGGGGRPRRRGAPGELRGPRPASPRPHTAGVGAVRCVGGGRWGGWTGWHRRYPAGVR